MRRSGILTGVLCAGLIWAAAGCDAGPAPTEPPAVGAEHDGAVSPTAAMEPAPISFELPCASVDNIPEELLAELLGIGAECPACGKAPWAVQSLDYEAEEFAYKRPCGHGNDMATVVTGQCTTVCASCGHTETLDMDEDIMYCPYENRYSENKAF